MSRCSVPVDAIPIRSIDAYVVGHWLLVHMVGDDGSAEGVSGAGEATYFTHPTAAAEIIGRLRDELLGHDALRTEYHLQRLITPHCLRDSALMSALSAMDQAMWDIKGKVFGAPIWQLLGGRVRDRVRAIMLIEAATPDEIVAGARAAVAEGLTAVKIKPFIGDWASRSTARALRDTAEVVGAVREAIGWDVDLAVEMHRSLQPADAEVFARLIADRLPYFIEDPIQPFSTASNLAVASRIPSPVAIAERATNIFEFREISDSHDVAILRPDIGLGGGFTGLRKVAAIAESRHQRIVPHNFTSPIVTAGHVQLAACTPAWDLQGYVREDREPWTLVVDRINTLHDGFLEIPTDPGLGMRLDLDHLENATYEPFGNKFFHVAAVAADGGIRLR